MNRLVLLRHGRTEALERHLYYGATDLPLLEDGVQGFNLRPRAAFTHLRTALRS